MPELPELAVVQEMLNRHILGQSILAAELVQMGAAIVLQDPGGAAHSL